MQRTGTHPARVLWTLLLLAVVLVAGLASSGSSDAGARLRPLPPVVGGEGGYAFLVTDGAGRPATFDPCRPVHWVLRPDGSPRGGDRLVHEAVAEVARRTGLHFVFDGVTDEPPADGRPHRQPERYGVRPAPVLVAWSTAARTPGLQGPQVGLGIASWAGDRARLISGQVVLDAEDLTGHDGGPTALAAATVRHELAHVVGLGHTEDGDQLMHATVLPRAGFGDGDLRGLRAAGSGPCA